MQGSPIFESDDDEALYDVINSSDVDDSDDYYDDEYYEYEDEYSDTSNSRGEGGLLASGFLK